MNLDMEAGDGIREQQHGKTAEWIRCLRSIGPLANSTTERHGSVG
ncbi:hypothetical protein NC652_014513 [Populus alba x Populus x berolinensis]|uniref:Uncharacterized protein n=1 Tax=Populus alba x Populus x berolinensis TaxID=444605 RepID=A0AAD6W4Y8_9ROSI|nr:hypothetical protein NC652_014513 [Populus alba x Populus x berolinensis]KAJ6998299.1 hypothetical protein NC653_014481 [Populus alba x Populus x berolinensis]